MNLDDTGLRMSTIPVVAENSSMQVKSCSEPACRASSPLRSRLVCLRFVFLLVVRVPAWLRLSRRPSTWKNAEILLLRHQVAVLQRQSTTGTRLSWADRALLAALLAVIPRRRHGRLHLPVTPATILRTRAVRMCAAELLTLKG